MTTTTTNPTCAARVESEWADLRDRLRFWMEHGPEAVDEGEGDFFEYGLAFDYVEPGTFDDQPEGFFRYQISWGGPSEEVRFYATPSHDGWKMHRAEFWFLDWFDGASVDVTATDEAAWLWEIYDEVGVVDAAVRRAA